MTKLANTSLRLPVEKPYCKHVYHLFTVYHPKGEVIKKILLNKKIQSRSIYPFTIQSMKAYKSIIKNKKRLKNSEIKAKGIFSLPLYPELKESEINRITIVLKKILKRF